MEKVNSSNFIERKVPKKRRLSKIGKIFFFCLFLLISLILYLIFSTKINSIKINGNSYIKDEYILKHLDLNENSSLFNVIFNFNKNDLKKNEMINDIKIEINSQRCIVIDIDENMPIGWQINNDINQLILADGTVIDLNSEYTDKYEILPFFVDISKEKIDVIAPKFAQIGNDILYRISEVHNLSFTYDSKMLKLIMDEGNYIYCSLEGIPYIKNYLQIIANDRNENNKCILIMEEYTKALKTDCGELDKYMTSQNKEE